MKKFIAAFLFVIILCGVASADIVYTTTDGKIGLITIGGASSIDVEEIQYETGLTNPIVSAYWADETAKTLVIGQSEDIENDIAIRFNSSNLTTPLDSNPVTLSGVSNASHISSIRNGRGLYLVYGSSIREFDTENLLPKDRVYTYSTSNEEADTNIKGALVVSNRIYVLVNNTLMSFDGQLDRDEQNFSEWNLESGAETICTLSGSRIAIGHSSGVQILGKRLLNAIEDIAQVKALYPDNGSGFYFVTQENSEGDYQNTLYHYTGVTTNTIHRFTGEHFQLLRNSNLLAMIMEEKIQFYNPANDDEFIKEFDKDELGGTPYRITNRSVSGEKDTYGSSGGCNLSNAGIIMFSLILCCVKISRKIV